MMSREELENDLAFLEGVPDKAELGDRACRRWPSAIRTALALMDQNQKLKEALERAGSKKYPEDGGW